MSRADYHFKHTIKGNYVDVYDYREHFPSKEYDGCTDADVVWGLDIETRDWGVKCMTPYIDDVILTVFDVDENEFELQASKLGKDWIVDWEWITDNRETIIPDTVMVYFKDKRIVVGF